MVLIGAGLGSLINGGALALAGGGTGLANAISLGAVGSAVGLGLAAYSITRPRQKQSGYGHQSSGYQSSGYHKRQGKARNGGPPLSRDVHVVAVSDKGPKRQDRVNGADTGKGRGRKGKVSGGRSGVGRQGNPGPGRPGKVSLVGKSVGKNRAKREQQDIELSPVDALQYEEQLELQETLELIRQHDTAGCGKRLMCELGGMVQEQLSIEELSILNLVRPNGNDVRGSVTRNQASLEYLDAKTRGQQGENCGNVFPLCTLNGKQLMNIVNEYLP